MGTKEVTMEVKYAAIFASVQAGKESVTEVCARLGLSRNSYFKYRARFAGEGLEGLRPRSRRPSRSPTATPRQMVELIIKARADLAAEGWDNGALSIFYRLLRNGEQPPVSRTIHRVLVRQGLVEPQPKKKPRSSYRRFEFPAPDDCWQIDAFDYQLAGGEPAVVFEVKDDCSRTQVANLAWTAEDAVGAWECLARGIDDFGKPHLLLSDNSLAFSGKLHHRIVLVEKNLTALGIKPITSGRITRKPAARTNAAIKPCSSGWPPGPPRPRWLSCKHCWTAISKSSTTGPIKDWIPTRPLWSAASPLLGIPRSRSGQTSPLWCGIAPPNRAASSTGRAEASR